MRISDWSSDVCSSDLLVFEIVEFVSDLVDYGLDFAHSLVIPVAAVAVTAPEMRSAGAMGRLIFAPGVENGFCTPVGVFMRTRSITPMPFFTFIIDVGYRSEQHRVGREWVSKCVARWAP